MKGIARISFLFLIFFFASAPCQILAQSDHLAGIREQKIIYFGTSPDFYPFSYYDNAKKITGIDIALAEEIAARLGAALQPVDFAYEGLADAVSHFQVDLIGGGLPLSSSLELKTEVSRVYFDAKYGLMSKTGTEIPENLSELISSEMIVGVRRGTPFDQYLNSRLIGKGVIPLANTRNFESWKLMEAELNAGGIDLILLDDPTYRRIFKIGNPYEFRQPDWLSEQYVFASHKGSNLINEVNRILGEMISDGSAQKIVDAYSLNIADIMIHPNFSRSNDDFGLAGESADGTPCTNDMLLMGIAMESDQPDRIRIYNTGSCIWDTAYFLRQVDGFPAAVRRLPVTSETKPGYPFEFQVNLSEEELIDRWTRWQMTAPNGSQFGQSVVLKRSLESAADAVIPE